MILAVVLSSWIAQAVPQLALTDSCSREAAVLNEPIAAYPSSAPKGFVVFAIVNVTVGPDGVVQMASMYKSTDAPDGDKEALRVARATIYSPKLVDCKPTTGTYELRIDFASSPQ
jgi:TonB family protein